MIKPLETKIKNSKEKELQTWETLIQPIIDGYGIKGIDYEFMPSEYNLADRIKMERTTLQLCNNRPFNSFQELLIKWQNSTPDTPDGKFSYKMFFIEFLSRLKEESTLPHFLEFLYREYEDEILSNQKIDKIKKSQLLPCEKGTKWEKTKITLVDDETVRIKTPQGSGRYSYHELGMSKRNSGKPKIIWEIFKLLAIYNGRLDSGIEEAVILESLIASVLLRRFSIESAV